MKIPVYIINGFLDSGKTDFIKYTLSQPYFETEGETLLLLGEAGEIEYEDQFLEEHKTQLLEVSKNECQDPQRLHNIVKEFMPERIVIEWNGMWDFKSMKLPKNWDLQQQITMIDATTFQTFFGNMKSKMADMVRKSDMIIFNRCDGIADLSSYKRNIKAINQNAEIIFEDSTGEVNQIMEDELPYSLQDPVIELKGPQYGIWYLDVLEHIERYIGKRIRFQAFVVKPSTFPADYFVPGRMAMTCCADDMAFLGFACVSKQASELIAKEWIEVTAVLKREYLADYKGEGPVLYAEKIIKVKAPDDAVISFV